MPRTAAILTVVLATVAAAGCGDEIGDSCSISGECSPRGDRFCDTTQPGGYCTIVGCDFGTCPEEAVCVRFFPVGNTTLPCDPGREDLPGGLDDCTFDEICTLGGYCAPRNSEIRFCMKACDGNSDCREQYECRDETLMIEHGGEPVPPEGEPVSAGQKFCAQAPI